MSRQHSGVVTIAAPLAVVRQVLLSPLQFPDWNPAFRSLTGPQHATLGITYALTVRPALSGHFSYAAIGDTHIETRWDVPGLAEHGTWDLIARDRATIVTHQFRHSGRLATLLEHAFRGVADLRLSRLADRAAASVSRT